MTMLNVILQSIYSVKRWKNSSGEIYYENVQLLGISVSALSKLKKEARRLSPAVHENIFKPQIKLESGSLFAKSS